MMRLMKEIGGMAYGIPPSPVQPALQPATATRTAPPGMKWILAPVDDPSTPEPELEQ